MAEKVIDRFTTVFNFRTEGEALARLDSGIEKVRKGLDAAAKAATVLGTALTAAAGVTIREFAKVERKMATVEGLVGTTREQLKAWEPDINRIGRAYGQIPAELADAVFFLTSAGLEGQDVMDVLEGSAKASAVGLGDVNTIANLVTGTMETMGLTAAESLDIVTATIREGKLDPESLTRPLSMLLPLSKELNVSFAETGGLMAILSRRNFTAATAGTGLRAIMTKMLRPSKQGAKELEKMGLSAEHLHDSIEKHGLIKTLYSLRTLLGDDKEAMGRIFEDQEALIAFAAVTSGSAEESMKIIEAVKNSQGDMDRAFAPILKTLSFRWEKVFAGFRQILVDMGERLAPMAHQVLSVAEAAIDWYEALGEGPKDFIASLLAMGPLLIGLGAALAGLSIALGLMVPAMKAGAAAVAVLMAPFKALFAVLMAHPFIAVGAAIVGLVVYWDEVRQATDSAVQWLGNAWARIREIFRPQDMGGGPRGAASLSPFQWLIEEWDNLLVRFSMPAAGLFDWLTEAWNSLEFPSPAGVFDWVEQRIEAPFAWITAQWDAVVAQWDAIALPEITLGIPAPVEGIFDWLTDAWAQADSALTVAADFGERLFADIEAAVAGTDFSVIGTTIGGWIGSALVTALSRLEGLLDSVTTTMQGIDWLAIGTSVGNAVGGALVRAIALMTGLMVQLTSMVETIDFSMLGHRIGGLIGTFVVDSIARLTGLMSGMMEAVTQIDFSNIGITIGNAIRVALVATVKTLIGLVSGLAQAIAEADWSDVGTALWGAIISALRATAQFAGGLFKGLLGLDEDYGTEQASVTRTENVTPSWWNNLFGGEDEGTGVVGTMAQGARDEGPMLGAAVGGVFAREVAPQLPGSDAERGPLSELTAAGRAIMTTLATGVMQGTVSFEDAFARALPDLSALGQPLPVGPPITAIHEMESETRALTDQGGRSLEVVVEKIEILVPEGDARAIGRQIGTVLDDQLRRVVERYDNRVLV